MKKRIISGVGTGKTKQLMYEAWHNNGIYVCQNEPRMREKANIYGFVGLKIISFSEFISDIMSQHLEADVKFYIDELEEFVDYMCLNTLAGYTLSID